MLILILWSNSFKICNIECQRLLQPRLEPGFRYKIFHSFNKWLLCGHLVKVKIIKCLRIPCRVHQSPLAMYHWYRDQPNIKYQPRQAICINIFFLTIWSCVCVCVCVCDELEPKVLLFCLEITRRQTKVWNFLKLSPYKRINPVFIKGNGTNSWEISLSWHIGKASFYFKKKVTQYLKTTQSMTITGPNLQPGLKF